MQDDSITYDSFVGFGFNRYAYCMYNPLKYVDPTGERYFGWSGGTYEVHVTRGMYINFGDGNTYITTARDIGNVYAGFIAEYHGLTYDITRKAFDSYNGQPEPPVSRYAQDYGYYLGKNYITPRWREKLYNIYRP